MWHTDEFGNNTSTLRAQVEVYRCMRCGKIGIFASDDRRRTSGVPLLEFNAERCYGPRAVAEDALIDDAATTEPAYDGSSSSDDHGGGFTSIVVCLPSRKWAFR